MVGVVSFHSRSIMPLAFIHAKYCGAVPYCEAQSSGPLATSWMLGSKGTPIWLSFRPEAERAQVKSLSRQWLGSGSMGGSAVVEPSPPHDPSVASASSRLVQRLRFIVVLAIRARAAAC